MGGLPDHDLTQAVMIDLLLSAAAGLYVWCALLLAVFVGSFGVLLIIYLVKPARLPDPPDLPDAALPSVTIQLPIYNEAHVVGRLLDACARLDYPADRLHIQLLDDSTDDTTVTIRHKITEWRARGFTSFQHIRRAQRQGYKAGALAEGLRTVQTDFAAVFDADFIPPRDFLRRVLPHFATDDRLALVQTRWDHLNTGYNWLTRVQALTIDHHFIIEQGARSRAHLPMSMNGSGGVWRVAALRDAGGWSAATLAEDLDVSYRALLHGWQFIYRPDVAVPGELPPQVQAYKIQQRRWATGMTECLIRHALPLLRSGRYSWGRKWMGLVHLSQFAIQPLMLLMFLLTPLLIAGGVFARLPNLSPLSVLSLIPLIMMMLAQRALYPDWPRRLLFLPLQGLVGAGMVVNNTVGVLWALHCPGVRREFKRTPKFNLLHQDQRWTRSRYALRVDAVTVGEIALGGYALVGLALALRYLPALAWYMLSYLVSFWGLAGWNILQTRRAGLPPARQPASSPAITQPPG
jgi:cellulose synthase/poly-beta-1,6-N-acetylglucosamine synthase-like glycosyltransferase